MSTAGLTGTTVVSAGTETGVDSAGEEVVDMVFCKPPKVNTCGNAVQPCITHRCTRIARRHLCLAPCTPNSSSLMPTHHSAETLLIEGPDARAFAHAQFSSPVSSLAIGQWQFSAWLDPQGRVRALFQLARLADERYLLLLRGGDAAAMADALHRFVFRSKLSVTAWPPRRLATGAVLPLHAVADDGENVSLGCGTHSLRLIATGAGDDAWRLPQLRAGWPWLPACLLGELLPPALSLQRLHAVAIDKGCYPGQEIVARLHFRGGHKRHLHRVTLSQAAVAGDTLRRDGREAGCVLDVVGTDDGIEALVVLSDDIAATVGAGHPHAFDDNLALDIIASWPA
ncbi:YgfZ/GcvT domain-containing protein [Rhodanobacter denitrificans]|nr:folate-binding protein [Rhodanobacter denitrificans]UJJ58128.1 folate-binding protein [Rhodanobacter denitrificans]UJM88355.1 folate-binding protein [Rhodanobacter denitrificans]